MGSYRVELARVLRRKELEVRDQEHFRQGSATLLEQLRAYIEQCDAVILLIGERCGAFPSEEHAAALGVVAAFEAYRAATGQALAIVLEFERRTGFEHPHRQLFSANYRSLLLEMGQSEAEIEAAIAGLVGASE